MKIEGFELTTMGKIAYGIGIGCWIIIFVTLVISFAHGQDIDCLQSHVSCSNKLVGDLELKLKIWNNANCSVRDICTPINETGEMPP